MLQSIERYMKQAIVDKLPSISSAALVSSLHIAGAGNPNASPGGGFAHMY
jgi:coatomer protein complex subunit gamma